MDTTAIRANSIAKDYERCAQVRSAVAPVRCRGCCVSALRFWFHQHRAIASLPDALFEMSRHRYPHPK
jgi:hypothetical protein